MPAFDTAAPDIPGSGTNLPKAVLIVATVSAGLSTVLSLGCVWLQLKNYRKIQLQRIVVRILLMVPIYSISSLISLYSLDAAFFLDAIRDIYEAFVIYCFFTLLVEYLGGERSLIILLHGRRAVPHPWPVSLLFSPMDVSDPFTFLGLKRGILQYVQIKPILAGVTVVMKAAGTYREGDLSRDSGYTYVSILYNLSVGLSLYCLAMFWVATSGDLKPFRPMPKFLCVKGIIFFSFWQGFLVSILVALGWVKSHRYPTELLSLAIQDTLICLEMPLFAFLHLYAFSYTDYIDANHVYSGRLPFFYALRDAFGYKDVFADSLTTVKGSGFSYRTFEPAEGGVHVGQSRDRRVRAGLRYTAGGTGKYWLPMPGAETDAYRRHGVAGLVARPFHTVRRKLEGRLDEREGYAPMGDEEAEGVVGVAQEEAEEGWREAEGALYEGESEVESLGFGEVESEEEGEWDEARALEFGDFNYPIVDASREEARRRMREEEEGIVHGKALHKDKGKNVAGRPPRPHRSSYGHLAESPESSTPHPVPPPERPPNAPTTSSDHPPPEGHTLVDGARHFLHTIAGDDASDDEEAADKRLAQEANKLPPDAVDLVVQDTVAEEEEMIRDRRRGDPGGKRKRVYRVNYAVGDEGEQRPGTPVGHVAEELGVKVHVKDTVEEGEDEVVRLRVEEEARKAVKVEVPEALLESSENPWN